MSMSKIRFLSLISILSLSLVGCAASSEDASEGESTEGEDSVSTSNAQANAAVDGSGVAPRKAAAIGNVACSGDQWVTAILDNDEKRGSNYAVVDCWVGGTGTIYYSYQKMGFWWQR